MSGKSRKIRLPAPRPRTMEELNKSYGELRNKLANAQYLEMVYKQETGKVFMEILKLDAELAERQALDKLKAEISTASELSQPQETQDAQS